MIEFCQGDIIKISGFNYKFLVVSKNSFIKAAHVFHVCPIISKTSEGPLHIKIAGKIKETGVVLCEQIKLIDPSVRSCNKIDSIPYGAVMNISDAIQGVFEYD